MYNSHCIILFAINSAHYPICTSISQHLQVKWIKFSKSLEWHLSRFGMQWTVRVSRWKMDKVKVLSSNKVQLVMDIWVRVWVFILNKSGAKKEELLQHKLLNVTLAVIDRCQNIHYSITACCEAVDRSEFLCRFLFSTMGTWASDLDHGEMKVWRVTFSFTSCGRWGVCLSERHAFTRLNCFGTMQEASTILGRWC